MREWVLAGRVIDAKEALAIGLVNEVVPSGQCLKRALELARFICQLPQPAIRADKVSHTALSWKFRKSLTDSIELAFCVRLQEAAVRGYGLPLDEGLRIEAQCFNR